MKLKAFAALSEDINNGWVWLPESVVAPRGVVKIINLNSGKKVYCEALQIGSNFLARYNKENRLTIESPESTIVINEWYRKKLQIQQTQDIQEFEICNSDNPWGHVWAALHHPQTVVRLAAILGILSVILGLVSIIK